MANIYRINTRVTVSSHPTRGNEVLTSHPPDSLMIEGFNLRVEVSPAEMITKGKLVPIEHLLIGYLLII